MGLYSLIFVTHLSEPVEISEGHKLYDASRPVKCRRDIVGANYALFLIIFLAQVLSVEDAKSEIVKIFQEAWEKEHGYEWEDQGPPIQRYAEDILRA